MFQPLTLLSAAAKSQISAVMLHEAYVDASEEWRFQRFIDYGLKCFTPNRCRKMANSLDECFVIRQLGLPSWQRPIEALSDSERGFVDRLNVLGEKIWGRATTAGRVSGNAIPDYMPLLLLGRMIESAPSTGVSQRERPHQQSTGLLTGSSGGSRASPLGCLTLLLIICGIGSAFGLGLKGQFAAFIGVLGVPFGALLVIGWLSNRREGSQAVAAATEAAKASCRHGMVGAAANVELCKDCRAEDFANRLARLWEQAEYSRQKKLNLARHQLEWVRQIRQSEYLKTMDPRSFENLVCSLFSKLGYRVEATPYSGDSGSDGYLFKDGVKSVLQCKRVQGSVGQPVLRDLLGTMSHSNSHSGIVVTTGNVSKQAREWVKGKPIRIIELEELRALVEQNFTEEGILPSDVSLAELMPMSCTRCGSAMEEKSGKHGRFYSCVTYPACRGTRPVSGANAGRARDVRRTFSTHVAASEFANEATKASPAEGDFESEF